MGGRVIQRQRQKQSQKQSRTKKRVQASSRRNQTLAQTPPDVSLQLWLQMAQLRAEKCELKEATTVYLLALEQAKAQENLKGTMEALAGLLRLASEALDEKSLQKWDRELQNLMHKHPGQIPAMAWYCKGACARHRKEYMQAQRDFHRYLKAVRRESNAGEALARGWVMLATVLQQRRRYRRSEWLAREILKHYESCNYRSVNGIVYLLLGTLCEHQRDYTTALGWFQKAYSQFVGEHNWYYFLYVLYGYARLERGQGNFSQAYRYLSLIEQAAADPEFGCLKREISQERLRLEQDSVDLLIDANRCTVQTRGGRKVSLGKQYVLLHLLEVLSKAHTSRENPDHRGLSKAEIIETVWKERYRCKAHDNKLYYNINRLRKLIEPDFHKPQYLLNWKRGYRFAPGLRIQYVSESGHTASK